MQTHTIVCPKCGSQKLNSTGSGVCECVYCGNRFVAQNTGVAAPQSTMQYQEQGQQQFLQQPQVQSAFQNSNVVNGKSKLAAGLLAILLGSLGVHKFYLNKPVWGIVYLLFCWSYIPGIIGLVEGIVYLCMSDNEFNEKYNF